MTPYLAVVSARFRVLLQYRAAAFAGVVTQTFFGFVRLAILLAFFRAASGPQPMTPADLPAYIWLGQAMFQMVPWSLDREVAALVRTGGVSYELLRPVDLYNQWFARALALRTAPVLLRALPMVVLAAAFFGLGPPPSAASGLAFAASVAAALLLSCALTVLLNVTLMWTLSGEGVSQLVLVTVIVFSGLVIPLPFFPDWFQPVVTALPFAGLMDTPLRLYTGNIPATDAVAFLTRQVAWTLALVLAGRALLARGTRRLVIHGG
ncbi:MAG: ABC-2 family transporter protein [Planctomycetes bacterium]|nr:ABC-2 family transporter protein [Planctomycetota bacterium]